MNRYDIFQACEFKKKKIWLGVAEKILDKSKLLPNKFVIHTFHVA